MTQWRLKSLVVLLVAIAACTAAGPVGTGAQSSGTSTTQDTAADSANNESSGSESSDSDSASGAESDPETIDPPADVTDPATVTPPTPAVCGNSKKETGEDCDDGNTLNWDGCTSACKTEAAPTLMSNFTSDDGLWSNKFKPTGSVTYGAANTNASDQKVARLIFAGSPGPSPSNSSQIRTKTLLGFGMYRARVSLATCATTEEVVNGIFTYSYSGATDGVTTLPVDGNSNGIKDNNEIDFEVLCGEPRYLWMTSWTDYQEVGGVTTFRKVSRVVNMTTGKYYQTRPGKEGVYGIEDYVGTNSQAIIPGFATGGDFYEIGFDWQPTFIRFFIMIGNTEVTLWTLDNTSHPNGASYIPQNKAYMMFNIWYTPSHWWVGGAANSPANPATLDVDWFKYWAN